MVSVKPTPKFVAFGNCLVDRSVQLWNDAILKRFRLNPNEVGECSQQTLDNIIASVTDEKLEISTRHLGGSALNTCRILKSLGSNGILFCGAVGDDDNGRFIEEELKRLGIDTYLQKSSSASTGTCVCLIHDENRCCFANIGASTHFKTENLLTDLSHLKHPTDTVIFYMENFFLTERLEMFRYIFDNFIESNSNVIFAFNLSARYVIEKNFDAISHLLDRVDIVFGNKEEFEVLAKCYKQDSVIEFIFSMSQNLKNKEKTMIITNGNQPVEVYLLEQNRSFVWETLDVRVLPKHTIIDTTGAGDAFVAGYCHSLLQGKSAKSCTQDGIEVAGRKLKHIGAQLK